MHNDFHGNNGNLHELHAVKHYFTVEEEGDLDLFFDAAALGQEPEGQQVPLPPLIDADVNGVNQGGANKLIPANSPVLLIQQEMTSISNCSSVSSPGNMSKMSSSLT